jgi:hypothetical protein
VAWTDAVIDTARERDEAGRAISLSWKRMGCFEGSEGEDQIELTREFGDSRVVEK